jgi:hypothetical protein
MQNLPGLYSARIVGIFSGVFGDFERPGPKCSAPYPLPRQSKFGILTTHDLRAHARSTECRHCVNAGTAYLALDRFTGAAKPGEIAASVWDCVKAIVRTAHTASDENIKRRKVCFGRNEISSAGS